MNPQVDTYLKEATKWQEEMRKLRKIALGFPLTEELKWGKPCYTFEGRNVVLIIGFKNYCSFLLGKGALLKDPEKILVKAGENTQGARQIRFTSLAQIVKMESLLRATIREAIEVEKAGKEVDYSANKKLLYPPEFQAALEKSAAFKMAFEALTPGRQRAYNIFFTSAKQSATRAARVEKWRPQILKGKGMFD